MPSQVRSVLRWLRLGLKWTLVACGLYVVLGLAVIELQERRLGLGTGFVFAIVAGGIKGLLPATRNRRRKPDAEPL